MGSGTSKGSVIIRNETDQVSLEGTANEEEPENASGKVGTQTKIHKFLASTHKIEPVKCINSDQQEDLKRKDVTNIVEQKCTSCDSETKRLTYLVSELESQNAVLLQSVKKLQLQLNSVHASDGMNENPDAGISFLSQNEITASLRQDLDATRSRIKKLTAQYKKKLRQFNTEMAECKQDHAIKCMEYQSVIDQLNEDKSDLLGRIELLQNGARDACPAPTSDSRTALVLQLSAKVSEQEAEITRLNGVMRQQRMQSGDSDSAGARIPSTSTSTNAAPQRSRWISSAERELQSKELDGRRSSISGGDECDDELDNIRSCSRSVDVDVAVASRKDSVEKARIEMSGRDSGCGASDDIEIGGKSADDVRSVNSVESENSGLYGGDVTDFALGEGDSTYNINPANLRKVSAARDRRRNVPPIAETGETYSEAAVGPLVSRKPPSGKKNCDQMIL